MAELSRELDKALGRGAWNERAGLLRKLRDAKIELLLLDFDGVLTDNRVHVHADGSESVVCHRGDGYGIARARAAGVYVAVITCEPPILVHRGLDEQPWVMGPAFVRGRKLGIPVYSDPDKGQRVRALLEERAVPRMHAAYVGNDLPDIAAMREVAWPIAVADAHPDVHAAARLVTPQVGGAGAVRQVCEWIADITRGA